MVAERSRLVERRVMGVVRRRAVGPLTLWRKGDWTRKGALPSSAADGTLSYTANRQRRDLQGLISAVSAGRARLDGREGIDIKGLDGLHRLPQEH